MDKKTPTFEEKLDRLSEIAEKVENSTLPLEESLKLYDEGIKLVKELQEELSKAKDKIGKHKIIS